MMSFQAKWAPEKRTVIGAEDWKHSPWTSRGRHQRRYGPEKEYYVLGVFFSPQGDISTLKHQQKSEITSSQDPSSSAGQPGVQGGESMLATSSLSKAPRAQCKPCRHYIGKYELHHVWRNLFYCRDEYSQPSFYYIIFEGKRLALRGRGIWGHINSTG